MPWTTDFVDVLTSKFLFDVNDNLINISDINSLWTV